MFSTIKKARCRLVKAIKQINKTYISIVRIVVRMNDLSSAVEQLNLQQKKLLERINNSGTVYLSENELMTKIFSGAKMYLDPKDRSLTPHLILDGNWEWDITQAWLRNIKEGDVVFDIGANFGYFGLLAIQQTKRQSSVVLFEANPNLIPYIEKTFMVNSFLPYAKIENMAVADKPGNLSLHVVKGYTASSSIYGHDKIESFTSSRQDTKIASAIKVKATTIDQYCHDNKIEKVNLIKMDIEGYEDKAYYGMRETIKSNNDLTMFIEFSKEAYSDPKKFYEDMLSDFGNVYLVSESGVLNKQENTSYDIVVSSAADWVMLVLSKSSKLK